MAGVSRLRTLNVMFELRWHMAFLERWSMKRGESKAIKSITS